MNRLKALLYSDESLAFTYDDVYVPTANWSLADPDMFTNGHFARFACRAGDWETLRSLLARSRVRRSRWRRCSSC